MATIGCKVPNTGDLPAEPGLGPLARLAEEAGATSLWVADHVIITGDVRSRYPYSADGRIGWDPAGAWYEALTACAWAAANTSTAEVGTAVLVVPQRDPVLLAKTAASIDALSGGRMVLGVGAGWYAEEFENLGWDFMSRGRRLNEAIDLMRALWTGRVDGFEGEFFQLTGEIFCHPRPARSGGIPIVVGGMTRAALRRAAERGDGWLALAHLEDADPEALRATLERVQELRPPGLRPLRCIARIVGEFGPQEVGEVGALTRRLADAGFDEVVIDPPWPDPDAVGAVIATLQAAVA